MFINDVNKKEEIRNIAIKHLRKYGIKHRIKISRQQIQVAKSRKLFNVSLQNLENKTVTLKNGQQLIVPKRLHEMCSFILTQVEIEGIFRKEGSKSRQNEIKLSLDRGCLLGNEHHVIDVAVILKYFLRELPEPLIPYSFHELFLRCSIIEKRIEAILLACLLIPTEHLNVLSYFMQFLSEVANYSKYNKMNAYNLAIIVGPNIFPINEKVAPKNKLMVKKTCDIVKLMIDHSRSIGLIPDYIIEQIGSFKCREFEAAEKVKRRRSGSLTRIFNGLKKIVSSRVDDDIPSVNTVTPDLLLTPSISNSDKKSTGECKLERNKLKDGRTLLERRWSSIASAANLKRKKQDSFAYHPINDNTMNPSKAEYVRVSKTEYEEIKNRVSAIEKRLSLELENVQSTVIRNEVNIINNIQTAYEKTLGESEPMSSGTDQLARRMSRELRIRTPEQKIIRSPSARKIGNIKRRSKELDKPNKLKRNSSLQHMAGKTNSTSGLTRSISSPIKNNITFNTNIFSMPVNFNTNTRISFSTPSTSSELNTGTNCNNSGSFKLAESSPIKFNCSDENNSSRLHLTKPRDGKVLKRTPNVTPLRRNLKHRIYNFDGHHLMGYSGIEECNKENGLVSKEIHTPKVVPHIKKAIPIVRTPKKLCNTPKGNRINTPFRVLPGANCVSDIMGKSSSDWVN